MTVESYSFIEHFDYLCHYIPQPFFIKSEDFESIYLDNGTQEYVIKTTRFAYTVPRSVVKKLVNDLGIKMKLLSAVTNEDDVIDLVLPAVNKLFKCFADCFVFYATADEPLTIIDLNVHAEKGAEGTKYENGPSPWKGSLKSQDFTCFADFMSTWFMDTRDHTLQVKSEDIMPRGSNVVMKLFKPTNENIVPMLLFTGKFSNMNGFSEVHPVLYDSVNDIELVFPMNYAHKDDPYSFEEAWHKLEHVYLITDFNDYISREMNELAASDDTPSVVKNFISSIITDSTLNANQPIKDIISDAVTLMNSMKPSKKKKFAKAVGSMISWCVCMKHAGCSSCGSIHI